MITREPLRVIQAGAGRMGREWISAVAANPRVDLVGVVDLDRRAALSATSSHGLVVPVAATVTDLLAQVKADALINVTVPASHVAVTTEALMAGLAVLCEKPLAPSVTEGWLLVAASAATDQLVMVSQSRRYWNAVTALREQISQLGRLGSIHCSFAKAAHFGGFREEMGFPLLIDMAIHHFDLARALTGHDPVRVYCDAYNPPWSWFAGDANAEVIFELGTGIRFSYSGSWCAPGLETSWNGEWRITGETGSARWDGDHHPVAQDVAGQQIVGNSGTAPEQIAGSLTEFVEAVSEHHEPDGEVRDNLVSLAMVEAAIRSATTGEPVWIADVLTQAWTQAMAQAASQPGPIAAVLGSTPDPAVLLRRWPGAPIGGHS
ncbi:MAG: Gfo/Idh/MocA family protein [Propioniciclava sp.]